MRPASHVLRRCKLTPHPSAPKRLQSIGYRVCKHRIEGIDYYSCNTAPRALVDIAEYAVRALMVHGLTHLRGSTPLLRVSARALRAWGGTLCARLAIAAGWLLLVNCRGAVRLLASQKCARMAAKLPPVPSIILWCFAPSGFATCNSGRRGLRPYGVVVRLPGGDIGSRRWVKSYAVASSPHSHQTATQPIIAVSCELCL